MPAIWLSIFKAILGEAEQIIPIFIHNPKSQAIEGVIVTTVNGALNSLGGAPTPAPSPVPVIPAS